MAYRPHVTWLCVRDHLSLCPLHPSKPRKTGGGGGGAAEEEEAAAAAAAAALRLE
jgi:hypothetical protein